MPRQIIDTESSRPRYVRRIVLSAIVVFFAVAVLIAIAFIVLSRPAH